MLKSPRRSINPDRAIKKFKNTRKLCGLDFSHEVGSKLRSRGLRVKCSMLGLFGIRHTSHRSGWTCLRDSREKVRRSFSELNRRVFRLILSLISMENSSITNPVNAFVTGEVIVERNEHKSSKALVLDDRALHSFVSSSRSTATDQYSNDRLE